LSKQDTESKKKGVERVNTAKTGKSLCCVGMPPMPVMCMIENTIVATLLCHGTKCGRSLEFLLFFLIRSLFADNIKVVLLQESKIFASFGEFTFFHTFSDIPMDISPLGVHHVVLLAQSLGKHSVHGNVVSDHGCVSLRWCHVVALNCLGRDVVQTNLETGWAPLDEGNFSLSLDPLHGGVGDFRFDGTTIVEGDGHVLVFNDVEVGVLDEEAVGLEAVVGDSSAVMSLVGVLVLADHRGERGGHEVETWERHQVRLELVHIDVQFTIESKGGGHRGHNLGDDSVQVGVGWLLDVQLLLADLVQSFVVKNKGHVGVVQQPMRGQKTVVWLDDARGDVGRWVDFETNLGFLSVVDGETLEDQHTHTGTGSSTNGVVDDETLDVLGVIDELSDSVVDDVHLLLSDGVVTTGEVVGSIFLSVDEEFWVVHSRVLGSANVIKHSWLKINTQVPWHVLSGCGFLEESVEVEIFRVGSLHSLSIGFDVVLADVLGPDGISKLDSSLSDTDG